MTGGVVLPRGLVVPNPTLRFRMPKFPSTNGGDNLASTQSSKAVMPKEVKLGHIWYFTM